MLIVVKIVVRFFRAELFEHKLSMKQQKIALKNNISRRFLAGEECFKQNLGIF